VVLILADRGDRRDDFFVGLKRQFDWCHRRSPITLSGEVDRQRVGSVTSAVDRTTGHVANNIN